MFRESTSSAIAFTTLGELDERLKSLSDPQSRLENRLHALQLAAQTNLVTRDYFSYISVDLDPGWRPISTFSQIGQSLLDMLKKEPTLINHAVARISSIRQSIVINHKNRHSELIRQAFGLHFNLIGLLWENGFYDKAKIEVDNLHCWVVDRKLTQALAQF